MELSFANYPVFQANQVLTSGHLNDLFDYLDEQTRLTRANLIGIGIVCGLEIKLDTSSGTSIRLSRGCGVTSMGYLIIEPEDVHLVAYREYKLPPDVDYPNFKKDNGPDKEKTQYPMWELFEKGEANTTLLNAPAGFLDNKAVVLFLELKKEGLRNCSPNNCDDKGAEVTITVRRLLVQMDDLDQIIAAANGLGTGLTSTDLANALSAELKLPDIHVPRFDVPNSNPATSEDVYAAFLNVFRSAGLAKATGQALSAAYNAFKPLLASSYSADPFADFPSHFGFLDTAPTSATQVRFLQYYLDLFEDLLHAYDEFRWHGMELICACCPPDGIFPRHLMLGLLHPESSANPAQYRETFRPSPAVGNCAADSNTVLQLFRRLVEMAEQFTNSPTLPKANPGAHLDPQIRITPSALGDVQLDKKAIPFYFQQDGTPPLYQLWSPEKTLRGRANQNLSYRYDDYSPTAPAFVRDPLHYDLERYNFLRIEGHLGKAYTGVLTTLLSLKSQYRLPIDIIALRTGEYDDKQKLDPTQYPAQFQDLETLYDSLREELLSSLAEAIAGLYDIQLSDTKFAPGTPKHPLLRKYTPYYRFPETSVGGLYEANLASLQSSPYIDINQTLAPDRANFAEEVRRVTEKIFKRITDPSSEKHGPVVVVFYLTKLSDVLPSTLGALNYADLSNRYQDLLVLVRFFREDLAGSIPRDLKSFVPQAELMDQFDEILFNRKLDAIKAVSDEYARRVGELKKMLFLSTFLQRHPGIQHKAGVPMGGTFLLVYHGEPTTGLSINENIALTADALTAAKTAISESERKTSLDIAESRAVVSDAEDVQNAVASTPKTSLVADMAVEAPSVSQNVKNVGLDQLAVTDAVNRISADKALLDNPDVSFLIRSLTGDLPLFRKKPDFTFESPAARIIANTVNALSNGTVIADFYLPYKISSDLPGIQFVLPEIPPGFSTKIACTNSDGFASVDVDVKGGAPPYDMSIDGQGYVAFSTPLSLRAGTHTLKVRDAEAVESAPQTLLIPAALAMSTPEYACAEGKYTATFTIIGGTPPYTVNGKAVSGTTFTTDLVDSGKSLSIELRDSVNCSIKGELQHDCPPPCTLPCDGQALRRGYRFWLPEPDADHQYNRFETGKVRFLGESTPGKQVDLSEPVTNILVANPRILNSAFQTVVKKWLAQINELIAGQEGLNQNNVQWLTLSYESNGEGRYGTLWLEYFDCLKFDIEIDSNLVISDHSFQLRVSYTPENTSVRTAQSDIVTTIPAFGGERLDKCEPNKPAEEICPQPPKLKLAVRKASQEGNSVAFEVKATPDPGDLVFLWEVPAGDPQLGNGVRFITRFAKLGVKAQVTVTAFNKNGCSVTVTTQIAISK